MLKAIRLVCSSKTSSRLKGPPLAGEIANLIAINFSASSFQELFRPEDLAPGRSVDQALAQWYALAHLALTSAAAQDLCRQTGASACSLRATLCNTRPRHGVLRAHSRGPIGLDPTVGRHYNGAIPQPVRRLDSFGEIDFPVRHR